jgi:hypothetical protein
VAGVLGGNDGLVVVEPGGEVIDLFGRELAGVFSVGDGIAQDMAETFDQADGGGVDAGFLLQFAQGTLENGFAFLQVAFGEIEAVVVLHEQHFGGAAGPQDDHAARADGGFTEGRNIHHARQCRHET